MVKEIDIAEMHRHLGIKRLRKRIPVSDFKQPSIELEKIYLVD